MSHRCWQRGLGLNPELSFLDRLKSFVGGVGEARANEKSGLCDPEIGSPEACEAVQAECTTAAGFELGGATGELLVEGAPDLPGPPRSMRNRIEEAVAEGAERTSRMLDAIRTGLGEAF